MILIQLAKIQKVKNMKFRKKRFWTLMKEKTQNTIINYRITTIYDYK
jgi:hypothetical protein